MAPRAISSSHSGLVVAVAVEIAASSAEGCVEYLLIMPSTPETTATASSICASTSLYVRPRFARTSALSTASVGVTTNFSSSGAVSSAASPFSIQ